MKKRDRASCGGGGGGVVGSSISLMLNIVTFSNVTCSAVGQGSVWL